MEYAIDQKTTSRFFALPRELRNLIYDAIGGIQATDDKTTASSPFESISIMAHPIPGLLRVAKQFADEYRESRTFQQVELVFHGDASSLRDHLSESSLVGQWTNVGALRAAARTARGVKVGLTPMTWDNTIESELSAFVAFMRTHMPQVTRFEIELTMPLENLALEVMDGHVEVQHLFGNDRFMDIEAPESDVKRTLILKGRLCGGIRFSASAQNDWLPLDEYSVDVWDEEGPAAAGENGKNLIVYQAMPSSDPEAWLGLELRTVSAGSDTVEEMVESMRGLCLTQSPDRPQLLLLE